MIRHRGNTWFHIRNLLAGVRQNIWVEFFTSPFTFVRQPWFKDESRIAGYMACVAMIVGIVAVGFMLCLLAWVLAL